MITKLQIKKIHTLVKALGWDDDLYREAISLKFNKNSSKELTSKEAESFILNLEKTAITLGVWKDYKNSKLPDREGMATQAQINKINMLWREVAYKKNKKFLKTSLRKFLEKQFKVSDIRFVEKTKVSKIIKAIETVKERSSTFQNVVEKI